MKTNIFGMFAEEIAQAVEPYGLQKYRGEQIARWIYQHNITDFAQMTNLSVEQRKFLAENFAILTAVEKARQAAADRQTSKYLLLFSDGAAVETVLMCHPYGNSVCVSTQVGCAMGCLFCASTLHGIVRNLTGGEILAQLLYIDRLLAAESTRVNTIVIMGSGEPLANYDHLLRFIHLCHQEYCLNLSYRNITVSTCGIVPEINKLAAEGIPVNLSISLHAPTNEIRSKLMPINQRFPLETVLVAADRYAEKTGRRITYEYILIDGINDKPEHAAALAAILKGRLANVNLIPVNPVPERGLLRPSDAHIKRFFAGLQSRHINVTIRHEMGADIQAACGQLRNRMT
ncbi:MAG: 23S rRNA (adenine(2503)-C(2))-methyltransferase RlmN [Veillonellales bacterium]